MQRRSAHRSTPRKRYTIDAFENIPELEHARSSSEPSEPDIDPEDSAEDFALNGQLSSPSSASSVSGADDDLASNPASDAGERLLDDALSIASSPGPMPQTYRKPGQRGKRPHGPRGGPPPPGPKTYTRGLTEGIKSSNLDQKRTLMFGKALEDARPAYEARARWGDEPTLPSRREGKRGGGGMRGSFYVDENILRRKEREERQEWGNVGGVDEGFGRQQLVTLQEEEGRAYLPEADGGDVQALMGPYASQHLYKLNVGGSMPLIEAWNDDRPRTQGRPKKIRSNYKNGFLINAGARVRCLDWAPHQHGQYQYLAVSVLPRWQASHASFEAPGAPAFTPQLPHKASIQIWKLKRREDGTIDTEAGCKLAAVLCTDWGDVKDIKFCPMPTEKPESSNDNIDLGLLAGLWADGAIRVLRLNNIPQTNDTAYIHIIQPAFSSRPPTTVCTCLAWISSTRIAAGCANGFLAIWDLPKSITSTSTNPRPTNYTSLSHSYILSITTCYPSRPHFLLSVSMAGYNLLTDLSRPGQPLGSPSTAVFSNRIRISQRTLAWHDHLQLAVHQEDNHMVRGAPIRRVFASTGLARAKGTVTSVAVSPCHPFMLVGSAGGEVSAVNPVGRVLENRGATWQQVWFAHEWRRQTGEEAGKASENSDEMEVVQGEDVVGVEKKRVVVGANGLSRILEGFKIEKGFLAKEDSDNTTQKGVIPMTVFEEKSAVSALSWNPNLEVGGWAAAGMADGLLRIEDIAT